MTSPHCSYEGCTRPIHNTDEGKCIFHAKGKNPKEFRKALAQQIRQWRKEKAIRWNFSGWVFVDAPRHSSQEVTAFHGKRLFHYAHFPVWAEFRNAVFLCDGDFYRAKFLHEGYFHGVRFEKEANFSCSSFAGEAHFNEMEVSGYGTFQEVEFRDGASFQDVVFQKGADFSYSQFRKISAFNQAEFLGESSFYNVAFDAWVGFKEAVFVDELDLEYVSFRELGDYRNAVVAGEVRLAWPGEGHKRNEKGEEVNRGRLLLEGVIFEVREGKEESLLDLRGNALQDDCKLLIHDTKMERVLLEGADCRQIEFYNVAWGETKKRGHAKRRIVADERFLRDDPTMFEDDKPSWNEIAVTYQQLSDRFRKDLDHPTANDFERGIFEARLMAAKEKGDWKNAWLLGIYKWASDFSGSIWRPAYRLLWVLALSAIIYAPMLYSHEFAWSVTAVGSVLFKGAIAAVRVAILDRHWFSSEVDWTVLNVYVRFVLSVVALVQTVLTATLITLFIFSVRRRFKHSE